MELRARLITATGIPDLDRWALSAAGRVVLHRIASTSDTTHFVVSVGARVDFKATVEGLGAIFPTMQTDWSVRPLVHRIIDNDRVLFEMLEKA